MKKTLFTVLAFCFGLASFAATALREGEQHQARKGDNHVFFIVKMN